MYAGEKRNFQSMLAALIVCAGFIGHTARAADAPAIHIRNFGQVNDHVYRGGEPAEEGMRNLSAMHIILDIDLRESGAATEAERRIAQSLGMQYVNIPFPPLTAPSEVQVKRVLSFMEPDDAGRIFVHCRRGKDRTGTVIACYRIQHDGWDNRRAMTEASRYGMSWTEYGMRSFIMHFKPLDIGPATPLTR
jgi:tyrosine-protein phosphatase SIW14